MPGVNCGHSGARTARILARRTARIPAATKPFAAPGGLTMRVVAAPPRPTVGEARLRLTFATGELPVDARFEAFRDSYARRLFQMDMVCRTERPYAAAIDLRVTAPAIFGRIKGDEAEAFRAARVAAQCEEGVWVLMNRAGGLRVSQDDIQRELRPGEGIVFNAVRRTAFAATGKPTPGASNSTMRSCACCAAAARPITRCCSPRPILSPA